MRAGACCCPHQGRRRAGPAMQRPPGMARAAFAVWAVRAIHGLTASLVSSRLASRFILSSAALQHCFCTTCRREAARAEGALQ